MSVKSSLEATATEFAKYQKYVTLATIVSAVVISGIAIYSLLTKKGS